MKIGSYKIQPSHVLRWLNRHIKHNRDKQGDYGMRVVIHIPIGLLIGIPIIGWGLLWMFREYENSEDKWVLDEAWKDYAGALVGCAITVIILTVLSIVWLRHLW